MVEGRIRGITMKRLKIGLALSGGTAKSMAHIGVLKALEERDIEIDFLAGTSGGSVVAAFYAAGKTVEAMERLAAGIHWINLAGLTLPKLGLLSSEKIRKFIIDEIGDIEFSDLGVPLAVVAADLSAGTKRVFTEGKVAVACQASSSIPEIYTPVVLNGHNLVDGGLIEYVPIETLSSLGTMFKIGVNLGYERSESRRPHNLIEVITQVTNFIAQQNAAVSERLADFMIHPHLEAFGPFALRKAAGIIEHGYRETKKVIPALEAAMREREKSL
jgi:NTE family protein